MSRIQDNRLFADLIARTGPVVHLRDADTAGVSRDLLRRVEGRGDALRVGKAAFVGREAWDAANEWTRFGFRSIGFALGIGSDNYLTGAASALLHGIPRLSGPPALPTAVRPGDAHRAPVRSVHGRVRWGHLPLTHRMTRQRVGVVSPAYTVIDIARHDGPLAGLVAADFTAHDGLHPEIPSHLVTQMRCYPGISHATWALEHADPRCESPLETLGRYAFITAGRTVPLSNVWIVDGSAVRRVDHLIPEYGIVLEGDGDLKYNNRPDAAAIITDEKARERWLRSLGFIVIRYTYQIARYHPERLLAEVDREIRNRRGQPVPSCWSMDPPWAMAG